MPQSSRKNPRTKRRKPQRTCVVCRTTDDKRSLTRVVRTPDDGVHPDPTGKRAGRGAYLCDDPACWATALRGDALDRALRTTLTDADRERIRTARPQSDTA